MQYVKIYNIDVPIDTVVLFAIAWLFGIGVFINKVMGIPIHSNHLIFEPRTNRALPVYNPEQVDNHTVGLTRT